MRPNGLGLGILLLNTLLLSWNPSCSHSPAQAPAHTSDPASQHQAVAGSALMPDGNVSLFLKWFDELGSGVLSTERCMTDSIDQAKEFGDTSHLLRGSQEKATPFPLKCPQVTGPGSLNRDSSWKHFKIHLQVTSRRQAACHQLWSCHFISTCSHSCGKIPERLGLWSAQFYFWPSPCWKKAISHTWLFSNYHLLRHTPWPYYKENQVVSTYLQAFIRRHRDALLIRALNRSHGDSLESHFFCGWVDPTSSSLMGDTGD